MVTAFWKGLGRRARIGVAVGVASIAAVTAGVGYWALHAEYQALFSDLSPRDASAMAAELDRLKVPYVVQERGDGTGTTILVDRKDVHRTRLKVMGGNVPLHGAIGLELFDNSDFGMTEFAQKVNYQRALQGELTRTILSLSEVRDARVLLVLPEQGLFKQATAKAKASITVVLRQGQSLRPEQVNGIQRLVAASVAGIAPEDVTLVDQGGVALTRPAGEGQLEGSAGRLELKKDAEGYLARKATEILEQALGPGQALASVDVTLNLDRIQTTTEDVVAAPSRTPGAPTGVVVRERATMRDAGSFAVRAADGEGGGAGGSSQREVEYAVGRRVAQVVSQPGSIQRIQVVAVVKRPLDAEQERKLTRMVAASVGASADRGDSVVVHSIASMGAGPAVATAEARRPPGAGGDWEPAPRSEPEAAPEGAAGTLAHGPGWSRPDPRGLVGVTAAVLALGVLAWRHGRGRAGAKASVKLTEEERDAALGQVQAWLRGEDRRATGRTP